MRARLGRKSLRVALCAVAFGLALTGALALALAGWMGFSQHQRVLRETQSVEQIAAGQGRWIDAGDTDLYVQEWGRPGDPVVLLTHGTGAWSGTWFSLPLALTNAGWRVVAVDLPPFGLSRPIRNAGAPDYTRAAQAMRIAKLIEHLDAPVTLVGHSFGAGPALEAAVRGQFVLRQLVLVDPALGLGSNGEPPHCEADSVPNPLLSRRPMRTALVGATVTWPGMTALLLRQFVHRTEVITEEILPAYRIPFRRRDFSTSLGDWAIAFAGSACEAAHSLKPEALTRWAAGAPPVTLLWGEQDTVTPLAQAHALQRWIKGAKLVTLRGVGHIPHIEDSRAFEAALLEVLARAP